MIRMRKNWYTLLLAGSFVLMAAGKGVPTAAALLTREADMGAGEERGVEPAADARTGTGAGAGEGTSAGENTKLAGTDQVSAKAPEEEAEAEETDAAGGADAAGEADAAEGTSAAEDRNAAEGADSAAYRGAGWLTAYRASVEENFSQTLFIGDSRTEGLSEYGNLGEAEIFASSGMSVFTLFDKSVSLKSGEEKKLEELLSEREFRTIFLMLGINELGYEYPLLLEQYRSAVEQIQRLQPSAVLILEANFHVTRSQASQSAVFRNDRIDTLNQDIERLARETGSGYIDINPLFDDENGDLTEEYSGDGIHILARYYKRWSDWLRAVGIDS